MNSHKKQGLMLLNLGTPKAPTAKEVRKYLKEFLMDPYVLDVPLPIRWMVVQGGILPRRSKTSADAYKKIWTDRGSPLLYHLLDLGEKVQGHLGSEWIVQPAMRYGQPSIRESLEIFYKKQIRQIVLLPLYPQYSLAATESSIQKCLKEAKKLDNSMEIKIIPPFYEDQLFIQSFAYQATPYFDNEKYDHVLFSFHGLPERHVKKTDLSQNHCLTKSACCEEIQSHNQNCYRAQCYRTAELLAKALKLKPDEYTVCFQSRLGNNPWIKPHTDEFYRQLPKRGIKKLLVLCPAFVSDCLETLEEVQIRGREEFIANGGEDLKLVPSLNSNNHWAKSVAQLVTTFNS